MDMILYPERENWNKLLARPCLEDDSLEESCRMICDEVKAHGDEALRKYTWFFDGVRLAEIEVPLEERMSAGKRVPEELKGAMALAYKNIEAYHRLQLPEKKVMEREGFSCWQEARAIDRVGLYIPGGSAPLFSTVLMLGIPARLAGCREVVICTPPDKNGEVNPSILWAAELCGISRIFKVGGIQAIAAMALGTETVPQVDKIFGPGNRFVTAAKQWVARYGMAIDLPAGPSEVMVIADGGCPPAFVAADLLSQAEHSPDSQVILLCCDAAFAAQVEEEVVRQMEGLPRQRIVRSALQHSKCIVLDALEACMDMANAYAPEHLILSLKDAREWVPWIRNAGSVFLGYYSPESAGDYASGTNHTLPTNGYARAYSGVTVDAFMKKISFQEISPMGLDYLGDAIERMAAAECLGAHCNAVRVRRENLLNVANS